MAEKSKPEEWVTVWITYKNKAGEKVTKRGFWSPIFNHIAIPPGWARFNGKLLPNGFGGERIRLEEMIEWRPLTEEEENAYQ